MNISTNTRENVRVSDIPANAIVIAHRRPTINDWKRWAPRICARYKSVPARILIAEMSAEGLHVTEKMFRDRLRQWGKNDKNRRGVISHERSTMQPTNDEDRICSQRGSRHRIAYHSSSQPEPHVSSIPNPLHAPKDLRSVQQALKSMQNWQEHFQDSGSDQMEILQHTDDFYFLLRNISVALRFDRSDSSMCGNATKKLREASVAFQNCLGPMRTPIAVLSSIQLILRIVSLRDTDEWYKSTSTFLLKTVAETLPGLHPTPLLLQALLSQGTDPKGLAMIYDVGSMLIQRCYGKSAAINFRLDFVSAALDVFPDASFSSNAGTLCYAAVAWSDIERGIGLMEESITQRRTEELFDYLGHCCSWIHEEDDSIWPPPPPRLATGKERLTDYYAWRIFCNSQRMQCGFAGEEISPLNAHALMANMLYPGGGPNSSPIIRKLHLFYKEHDLVEQCEALRLEYPEVIEL